ncbi:MAG: prepilin-type N-terminal cleavage/methylation domain-containing protein [Proteobacteria bacterium]|nr:prepilin-type N-terminal cleavage/methylation domain-containing protein [Pseudomonadota bacterium]
MKTPRCHSSSRHRGLTLLELVMVVSILAILTALIVPGMNDQQEETRKTVAKAMKDPSQRCQSWRGTPR